MKRLATPSCKRDHTPGGHENRSTPYPIDQRLVVDPHAPRPVRAGGFSDGNVKITCKAAIDCACGYGVTRSVINPLLRMHAGDDPVSLSDIDQRAGGQTNQPVSIRDTLKTK